MNDSRIDNSKFPESKLNNIALEINKNSGTHSPKLNIYKLILEREDHPTTTYRDLFKKKNSDHTKTKTANYLIHILNALKITLEIKISERMILIKKL